MFAVPGWSVSAASLRSETDGNNNNNNNNNKGLGESGSDGNKPAGSSKSKKRKRPAGTGNVNAGNVATLWERIIEGNSGKKPKLDFSSSGPRKQKHGADGYGAGGQEVGATAKDSVAKTASRKGGKGNALENATFVEAAKMDKEEIKKRKKSKENQSAAKDGETSTAEKKPSKKDRTSSTAPVVVPPQPKLTPLQASMREKLISARFRHLNETLYTKPSTDAFELFEESPEMFQEYHEGFRRQVNVWPENPVDGYIEDIKLRGQQTPSPRSTKGKQAAPSPASSGAVAPLLRTRGVSTIADLGCGDANLAASLQSLKKKLRINILSYDLQSPSPLVTRADIAKLPLEDGSVNTVIFCLALMGTNWLDFIEEAYRILHWKGELWIAEIKSRFAPPAGKGKKGPVTHSVGNRKTAKKPKGVDAATAADSEAMEADLAIEVDGADDRRQETDVSAFVEALRKRGFVLQGEGTAAVDLRNKMFVKMHFIKGAPPLVGKNVAPAKDSGRNGAPNKGLVKFIDREDKGSAVDESSILKPCVYKLR